MDLSIVIPVCNESGNIPLLVERIIKTISPLNITFEIIFVTDENRDNTLDVLRSQCASYSKLVKAVKLSRRNGQHLALIAGLAQSNAKYCVIMDGDLQDCPEDIPALYAKALEGFDVVCGIKERKNDSYIRNVFSRLFNYFINMLADIKMDSNTSMFRILSRKIVDEILKFKEIEPSLNLIISLINMPTSSVNVSSGKRYSGNTNYSFISLINLSIAFILSFSTKPLRIISKLGIIMSLISFAVVIVTIKQTIVLGSAPIGWPTLIASMFMLSGLQIFTLGIIGEYIGKLFMQSKHRPQFIIEEKIGF